MNRKPAGAIAGHEQPETKPRSGAVLQAKYEGPASTKARSGAILRPREGATAQGSQKMPTTGGQAVKKPAPAVRPRNATLESGRYAINVYLWRTGDQFVESLGSILSQSLNKTILFQAPDKYAGDISLGQLRKLAPGMSSFSRIHRFCTSDGTAVTDETISLDEYIALDEHDEVEPLGENKHAQKTATSEPKEEPKPGADAAAKEQVEKALGDAEKPNKAKPGDTEQHDGTVGKASNKDGEVELEKEAPVKQIKARVPKLAIYYRSPARVATAGMDFSNATGPASNRIMPGSGPLGATGDSGSGAGSGFGFSGPTGSDTTNLPNVAANPTVATPISLIAADKANAAGNNYVDPYNNVNNASQMNAGEKNVITAGTLTEEQWGIILRNCAVFYGWKIDRRTGQIARAPRAAFRLRCKVDAEPVAQIPTFVIDEAAQKLAEAQNADFEKSLFEHTEADRKRFDELQQQKSDVPEGVQRAIIAAPVESKPLRGIPNFRVNDDSRIEITACQDSLAISLAKSDFSSQSTELAAAGGAYGVTVGLSAGYATSNEKKSSESKASITQTLVARYLYPRCDIFLRAEDLEPSPEFVTLLDKAKNQKSIDAVRAIHDQYGQLFCQELTLGARLLSTKRIKTDKDTDIEQHKEQMKVSVGASVQTPYGGVSAKHDEEKVKTNDKSTEKSNTQETNVFEAVGGDTILANNPAAWAPTAASPYLWRVINRERLSTMIDMVSEMPEYESAQSWFVQALPALNKYVRLDSSMAVNVRFKVQTPTNSLSVENPGDALFYLGFDTKSSTTPRLNGITQKTEESPWARVDYTTDIVIFHPTTFRAPCLHGFQNFQVGTAPFGSIYNAEFAATQWSLVAPFGDEFNNGMPYELKHRSRVILRTVPFQDPGYIPPTQSDSIAKDSAPAEPVVPPASHMVVFRNAQGAFIPGMSDRDEYQYWRIEKTSGGTPGEPIKGGDSVRLCWQFSDQTTGFRDYQDDVFGRRRNQCPPELQSTRLYLKVPWPRFEPKNTPTAMLMSAQSTIDVAAEVLNTRQGPFQYHLQDLQFRIDTVEQRGLGDSNDYMLAGVSQEVDKKAITITFPRENGPPLRVRADIGNFGLGSISMCI